ncbi:linear amide C-N hydrolase [Aquibaculum sediminis]|uniref:linear amide C-N hydrolase n=1 Tax=Aquibaculum sediminis TaxID=3231907 RepID=UPI00345522BB
MISHKLAATGLALAFALPLMSETAMACSRVLWNSNDQANVVARTMDLYMSDEGEFVVSPRGIARDGMTGDDNAMTWSSKYGASTITAFGIAATDGLNEAGLAANLLYLTGSEYGERDESLPGVSNVMLAQYALDNFGTVDEALEGLASIQVVATEVAGRAWPLHLSLADASGDSAVIEFIDGEMVVHHGRDVTVMTNEPTYEEQLANLTNYKPFGGELSLPGDIDPLSRFVRASTYLETLPEPENVQEAVAGAYSVVRNVAVPFGAQDSSAGDAEDTWSTLWFTLADTTNLTYFFQSTQSPNLYWVDFENVDLSEGAPVLKVDAYDYTLSGEISERLEPAS